MKKKILLTLMVIMLGLIAFGTISVSAATEGIYSYYVSGNDATIQACSASASGDIVVPNTLGGYRVTSIGWGAFIDCAKITSIILPDGLISINDLAFSGCTSLESFTFPNGVRTLGNGVLGYCTSLTNVTIPDSVSVIGESAFKDCDNLKNIYYAGTQENWEAIYISSGNESLMTATITYNYNDPREYLTYTITNGEVTITDCDTSISGELVIPSMIEGYPVTSVGYRAFSDCKSLTNIEIPDGVASIGAEVFRGCENLISITIPNSVKSIGESAFFACLKLENITIPDGVSDIADSTFNGCHSLANVTIPDSVTNIGNTAFYCCSSLTNITIPNSVMSIGDRAFVDCDLVEVYYNGTEEEWGKISIGSDNEPLTNATIHFVQVEKEEYRINEITIKDMSGNNLQAIPTGTFLATVSFTNVSSSADTVIILAQYTDAGAFKGLMYIQTEDVPTGSTIKLSIPVDNANGDVAELKAFCWESFDSVTPMGNSVSFPAEQ